MSEISRQLKAIALELKVPLIACAQLSRASTTRDNKRPALSDLRDFAHGVRQLLLRKIEVEKRIFARLLHQHIEDLLAFLRREIAQEVQD